MRFAFVAPWLVVAGLFASSTSAATEVVNPLVRQRADPLRDPNRHTRLQPFRWKADGTPDFGEPVPDGPLRLTQ